MIVYLLLAVENVARSLCLISTLYKGGIGQQRQPLKECVATKAAAAVAQRLATLSCSDAPTGRLAAVLSAKAKDFRVGRNGERGEIASSPSGGRVKGEHSLMRSVYRKTRFDTTPRKAATR